MAGLGVEKLEKLMPEIVATASKVDIAPHVRDGYIMMFNYLPITFGDKFTPYVGPIIPCILKVGTADQAEESITEEGGMHVLSWRSSRLGQLFLLSGESHLLLGLGACRRQPWLTHSLCAQALADENEFVRDTALRAGQRVISMYAETAIALLLPQLEQGLFDDLWRIR